MSKAKKCCVRRLLSATLALILVLIHLSTLASQSNDTVSFTQGEPHTHTMDFRLYFETQSAQVDSCIINIQNKIFYENKARSVVKTIEKNTEQLLSFLELEQQDLNESILYIVEDRPKGIQVFNNRIYCTYDDIESGRYLDACIYVSLNTGDIWKAIGIAQLIQENQDNNDNLAKYLQETESLDILSLHFAYFHPDFTNPDTIAISKKLAGHFSNFVISQRGIDYFLTNPCYKERQLFLNSLNVQRTYSDPYEGFDESFSYSCSPWYSFIVTTARGDIIHIKPLPDENLSHPFEVRILLYEMVEAPKAILAAIEKEAPDYLEIVQNNYAVPIEYFTSADRFSHTNINKRSVYLRHPCHVTHETTHILVPPLHSASAYSIQWQYEGIAEYLSQKYYPTKYIQELYYNLLTQKSANDIQNAKTPKERDFIQLVLDGHTIYLSENEMPNSASELNVREYMEARMKAQYKNPTEFKSLSISDEYSTRNVAHLVPQNGNELSYNEAVSFTDFLITKYSLSTFLKYCTQADVSFEEVFDLPYEDLKLLWIESLM